MAQPELKRELANRHVQLIAIGGTIGTGLFLGSGKAIEKAGPSIMITYLIVGIAVFFVMRALGELLLSKAGYQSFTDIAEDYLGSRVAFITGWTYWFCWIMTAMADVIAVGVYVQYWFDIPQWVPAIACLVVLLGLNLLTVKSFGELEFWFALIKVITILALIGLGVILLIIGFKTDAGSVTVRNLWEHGGFFRTAYQASYFLFKWLYLLTWVWNWSGCRQRKQRIRRKISHRRLIKFLYGFYSSMLVRFSSCYALTLGRSSVRQRVLCKNLYFSRDSNCRRDY